MMAFGPYELLAELTAAYGPSGREDGVRKLLAGLAKPFADEIRTDAMGNLICRRKGNGPRVLVAAPMDTPALMVTGLDDKGFARVNAIGSLCAPVLAGAQVRFENGLQALVCAPEEADFGKLKPEELFLDLGVSKKAEAEKLVRPGDIAVLAAGPLRLGQTRVATPFANRAACAALLLAMEKLVSDNPASELCFVFTAQNEVGCRGIGPAVFALEPDAALLCEAAGSFDSASAGHSVCALGKGPALKLMGAGFIAHPDVAARLRKLAKAKKIALQTEVARSTRTGASVVQESRSGVPCGGVAIPCRGNDNARSVVDLADLQSAADLIAAYCENGAES